MSYQDDQVDFDFTPRRIAVGGLILLLLCTGLGWFIEGDEFLLYKFFAPRREAVRREVFEGTKSYNDAMAQELRSAQMDYIKGSPEQRAAIGSVVTHRVAGYDRSKLPPDVQAFVRQVESDQGL